MTEVLFILTTVFVAYVVYVIVNEPKTKDKKATKPEPQKTELTQTQPEAVAKPVTPQENPEINKKTTTTKAVSATPSKSGLKDPQTGEVAKTYSNYRFTKRWIKDALVTEGLLDKVYKNNELNSEIEEKIKHALTQLEAIDKYQV
jgi:hypothetical protein